ncbi:peroxiredoxin-2D-like [Argentina anserina]|uniref:peroxiredoxin-2D-like n=1 Tax=Argentina anserina TaxID=57926 RepID=UPI002176672C|nr:peroxiredoxin-2D-like [Potentilla anserina]
MAASVNNIAATFATLPVTSSSSSSSSSSNPHQTKFSISTSHKSISASRNLRIPTNLRAQSSSLLSLYGPPGPPPDRSISARTIAKPTKLSFSIGDKLPNASLSYLNQNDVVKSVALSSLCKGKRVVLVGVTAPFSPSCTRFVKRVKSAREKTAEVIACVAVSDVFVMRAWGEIMAVGERVMMLCDGLGELTRALGASVQACLGLGERSRRFCLAAFNGVITNVEFDEEEEEEGSLISTR